MTTEASLPSVRDGPRLTPSGATAAGLYLFFTFVSLIQQPGRTTYDTRAELTQRPLEFLRDGFSLWHPESNFGEFQNQAYGYLFPQGSWFALADAVGVADWVTQRLWSALVLIIAIEGARRVGLALALSPGAAILAGLAYGMSPRLLTTIPVLTGEALPGAVLPWALLPVLLALGGRLATLPAVLLSGAAVVCMGGVNAVENLGSLPLVLVTVLWGWRRGLASGRFVLAWAGATTAASLWWVLPLLVLSRYAPPFYEYVESASNTTARVGWSEAVRGHSHWVAYLITGDRPWWPAGYSLVAEPHLVVAAALVAAIALVGLTRWRHPVRAPLVLAMAFGLMALTVAHGGWAGTPLGGTVRDLLDGPLAIFRNVHKIDPVVRLPLAIGFAVAAAEVVRLVVRIRPTTARLQTAALLLPGLLLVSLGQPFLHNAARTPGWEVLSPPWQEAKAYLEAHDDGRAALVLPGSGFAMQDWGWTLDEPLLILGGVEYAARSQVPLIPGESIRFLNALDLLATTGRATPALTEQLARAGVGHVVIRRDLNRRLTGSPHPGGAAVSAAKAGLVQVAEFGEQADGGPAVEVLEVPDSLPRLRTTPVDEVLTVRGAPESVLALQDAGLVAADRATVLEGETGWQAKADIVTDDDQRRERTFGATDDSVSSLLGAEEDWRTERSAHDFPAGPGDAQVVARYDGLRALTASSSLGYADNFGGVSPQYGPYAAVDGDPQTRWISSRFDARDQWLRLEFDEPRSVREVTVLPMVDDDNITPIRRLSVVAGSQVRTVDTSPSGAPSQVRFDGRPVHAVTVRIDRIASANAQSSVSLREVTVDDLKPTRTFLVPGQVGAGASWWFGTIPERRACNDTLGVPDCDVSRIRTAEEAEGMDRTFTTEADETVVLRGWVLPRATPEAARLLEPLDDQQVGVTSVYGSDPKVAGRFAYDGQATTAWVSDPQDRNPTLLFEWDRARTIDSVFLDASDSLEAPTTAIVRAGKREEVVGLTGGLNTLSPPITRKSLSIEMVRPEGANRVVVPEVYLGGTTIARPFVADAVTGATCGFGPNILIDGRRVLTKVTGTMADVVNGTPLRVESCGQDDGLVELPAGEHRLVAQPSAQFTVIELGGVESDAPEGESASRSLEVGAWGDDRRTATLGAGSASVVSFPENFNRGWVAKLDGRMLEPIRVDGWQQGWQVPEGEGGELEMVFQPQGAYTVILVLGLVVSGSVLLLGLLLTLRLAWSPGRRRELAWQLNSSEPSRAALALGWLLVLAVTGPVVAGALVLGLLAVRWTYPRRRGWRLGPTSAAALAAGVLVIASSVIDVVDILSGFGGLADGLAAAGVGLALGLVLSSVATGREAAGT
ncbi:alpha-(1-_3)-arabinofuranosyltransferase domain-containing protein [Nocardioides dilutus]